MNKLRHFGYRVLDKGAREVSGRLRTNEYDRRQNAEARQVYNDIVTKYPERQLGNRERRHIREYSRTVLGSTAFVPWLEAYTVFRGRFIEGWIPDNYFRRYVAPYSVTRYGPLDHRTLSARLFGTACFPDLAYRIDGIFYDKDFQPIADKQLQSQIFEQHDFAFAKWEGSSKGQGVTRIQKENFDPSALGPPGNLVIQRPVLQHSFFDYLSPEAQTTVRVTTVKPAGMPAKMRAGFLRIGDKGKSIVSGPRLRIPIADALGTLRPFAVLRDWTTSDRHPDTGESFGDKTIPNFDRVVATCESLHDRLPHAKVIGWDTCVSPEGEVELFEWNGAQPGIKTSEATEGPCFTDLGWDKLHNRS